MSRQLTSIIIFSCLLRLSTSNPTPQPSTTHEPQPQPQATGPFCTKLWDFDPHCPPGAICVPLPEQQEKGYCSCKHYDSGYNNHFKPNHDGNLELTECRPSTTGYVCFACYCLMAAGCAIVSFNFVLVLKQARSAGFLRLDALGTSTMLQLVSSALLGITRGTRALQIINIFAHDKSRFQQLWVVHILLSVLMSFTMVFSVIVLAVSALTALKRASVMMGLQNPAKQRHDFAVRSLGLFSGFSISAGVCVCSFTNQYHINALVIALGTSLTFCAYVFLGRSVSNIIRTRPANQNEQLRIPALQVISTLSTRLGATFAVLLVLSLVFAVGWVIGQNNRDSILLSSVLTVVNTLQYATLFALSVIFNTAVMQLYTMKLDQLDLARKRSLSLAGLDALPSSTTTENTLATKARKLSNVFLAVSSPLRRFRSDLGPCDKASSTATPVSTPAASYRCNLSTGQCSLGGCDNKAVAVVVFGRASTTSNIDQMHLNQDKPKIFVSDPDTFSP